MNCVWDETLFFNVKLGAQDFATSKVSVRVFDSNTISKDVIIGQLGTC